jgi:uncharacterized coiled-coil protein SlyX
MFGFKRSSKNNGEAFGLTSLEQQVSAVKIAELEMRIAGMEQAIITLCGHLKEHLDRIDQNTLMLDKNMHNLAAMTLRPPKDLLGGGQEPN